MHVSASFLEESVSLKKKYISGGWMFKEERNDDKTNGPIAQMLKQNRANK